jgi:hypothetical protein
MITELKNWWIAYRGRRKLSQLKEIDKWCGYIVDSLLEKQHWIDQGINVEGSYKELDKTLGESLAICLRVYHGVYADNVTIEEHAIVLLKDCIKTAEKRLGKELNKELKDF